MRSRISGGGRGGNTRFGRCSEFRLQRCWLAPTICLGSSVGVRRLKPEALRLFGIETGKAPCHATYHYFFQSLDADALSRTLGSFALKQGKAEHIAIDGKTLRGSRRLDDKAVHVLSAFATGLGAVIGDLTVQPDQNEITAALVLLKGLHWTAASLRATRCSPSARSAAISGTATAIISSRLKTINPP